MTEWVGRLGALLAMGSLLAGVAPGCDPKTTTGGDNSETHFLATCESECGGGLECICGVCTKRCSESDSCGDLSDDASCADSCGEVATKICDVTCSADDDCSSLGSDFACYSGHCRTQGEDVSGSGGAGSAMSGQAGGEALAGNGGAAPMPVGNCQGSPDLTPELLANSELDADVMARAAVVVGSCMPDDGVARNLNAMWSANSAAETFYHLNVMQARCLADSRCGCAGVDNCLGYRLETGVPLGCQSSCNGTKFRGCGDGIDISEGLALNLDCARYGMECSVESICVHGTRMACDDTQAPMCRDGARPLYCSDGAMREGPDCLELGLGCAEGKCQGTGATCGNENYSNTQQVIEYEGLSCQGGVLEACVVGKVASVSCAQQGPGFACQSVEGIPFCGLASDCLPAGADVGQIGPFPTSCDGTEITFCNAGRIETVDCIDLGFTGCDIASPLQGCTPGIQL